MEQLTNLIKTAEQNLHGNNSRLNPTYDNASANEIEDYLERLYLIIADSFNLSGQTPTKEEKATRAEAWARVLMGIVPAADLDRTFKFAFKHHNSNFPISAYDLRTAYDQMLEAERSRKEREHREFMAKMEADRRLTQYHECECYNTGFRRVADPNGGPHMGVVRCDRCRPEYRSSFYTA